MDGKKKGVDPFDPPSAPHPWYATANVCCDQCWNMTLQAAGIEGSCAAGTARSSNIRLGMSRFDTFFQRDMEADGHG